jgi:hypothetical protein
MIDTTRSRINVFIDKFKKLGLHRMQRRPQGQSSFPPDHHRRKAIDDWLQPTRSRPGPRELAFGLRVAVAACPDPEGARCPRCLSGSAESSPASRLAEISIHIFQSAAPAPITTLGPYTAGGDRRGRAYARARRTRPTAQLPFARGGNTRPSSPLRQHSLPASPGVRLGDALAAPAARRQRSA